MNILLSTLVRDTAPYAFAEVDRQVAQLKAQGISVIDFGVGDPSASTPNFVIDALSQAAQQRSFSGYPSYTGDRLFLQACAEYMKTNFGVTLNPDTEVTSTIGAKEAVFHFPLGFIDRGDVVICPTPGYPPYKNGTRFAGGVPYFVPLTAENHFLIDFEAIPKDVVQKTRIIWINYPNSPTGKIAPRAWLEKLIAWAHAHNIIIAADEGCYIDFYFDQKPLSILEIAREGIVTFYSLSKRNNMTGYRVGFCAGDERIIAALRTVKTNIDSGTPTFIQDAAVVALRDSVHVVQMRTEYAEKRKMMLTVLAKVGLPACNSEATFYLWQKASKGMTGLQLAQKFLEKGIVVTPGEWISDTTQDGLNPGREYVRIALVPSLEKVREAVGRLSFFKI